MLPSPAPLYPLPTAVKTSVHFVWALVALRKGVVIRKNWNIVHFFGRGSVDRYPGKESPEWVAVSRNGSRCLV